MYHAAHTTCQHGQANLHVAATILPTRNSILDCKSEFPCPSRSPSQRTSAKFSTTKRGPHSSICPCEWLITARTMVPTPMPALIPLDESSKMMQQEAW